MGRQRSWVRWIGCPVGSMMIGQKPLAIFGIHEATDRGLMREGLFRSMVGTFQQNCRTVESLLLRGPVAPEYRSGDILPSNQPGFDEFELHGGNEARWQRQHRAAAARPKKSGRSQAGHDESKSVRLAFAGCRSVAVFQLGSFRSVSSAQCSQMQAYSGRLHSLHVARSSLNRKFWGLASDLARTCTTRL